MAISAAIQKTNTLVPADSSSQVDSFSTMENRRLTFPVLLIATLLLGNRVTCQASNDQTEFLLVHGSLHGAWCWYKVLTILHYAGYNATALDLTSDGRDKTDADTVTSLAQLTKPLTDYLANVSGKVVLVGHSLGGATITYAMEQHSEKISKAVFLNALMPLNNQSGVTSAPPEVFGRVISQKDFSFNFANGPLAAPTSFSANLTIAPDVFYNESPPEDVTLALSLLDKEPYIGLVEVLNLTPARYGSIPRFYIKTDQDHVLTSADFTYILNQNPPKQTFLIRGGDHSAFFSKPTQLVEVLLNIATL